MSNKSPHPIIDKNIMLLYNKKSQKFTYVHLTINKECSMSETNNKFQNSFKSILLGIFTTAAFGFIGWLLFITVFPEKNASTELMKLVITIGGLLGMGVSCIGDLINRAKNKILERLPPKVE
jgi:hypothetical protein